MRYLLDIEGQYYNSDIFQLKEYLIEIKNNLEKLNNNQLNFILKSLDNINAKKKL